MNNSSESEPLLKGATKLTCREWLNDFIKRIRLSYWYVAFCLFNAALCVAIVVYVLFVREKDLTQYPRAKWLLLSEAILTEFILFETIADMIICSCKEYWQDPWHIFDVFVCAICVASLIIDIIHLVLVLEIDNRYISVLFLVLRFGAQGCR